MIRFSEIAKWARSGEYERILAGNYPRRADDDSASISDEIRNAAKSYRDSWNESADPFIDKVRDVAGAAAGAASGLFDRLGNRRGDGEN